MPDTTWPVGGHPPGSSRDSRYIPVPMPPLSVSTRHQRFACARLPDPYLTHPVRLFPHRSPRQSSANAAVGGLKSPPAGRLRRAYLHLPRSTTSRNSAYIKLLSAFVTHTCANAPVRHPRRRPCPLYVRALRYPDHRHHHQLASSAEPASDAPFSSAQSPGPGARAAQPNGTGMDASVPDCQACRQG